MNIQEVATALEVIPSKKFLRRYDRYRPKNTITGRRVGECSGVAIVWADCPETLAVFFSDDLAADDWEEIPGESTSALPVQSPEPQPTVTTSARVAEKVKDSIHKAHMRIIENLTLEER